MEGVDAKTYLFFLAFGLGDTFSTLALADAFAAPLALALGFTSRPFPALFCCASSFGTKDLPPGAYTR